MEEESSPKQLTLTQYSMNATSDNKRCAEEEKDIRCNRASAICTVRAAIENNPRVFAWKRKSRNDDITEETNRRNAEIMKLDDNCSDDDFMPKPQRKYTKPTFTRPPHPTQQSIRGGDSSSDDDVVVAQVVKVCNQKISRGTKRKKVRQEKKSSRSSYVNFPIDSSDEYSVDGSDDDGAEASLSGKKKYLSQKEVAKKYGKLLDRNRELEKLLRFARKQLAFYRCKMGMISEQARHPTLDDIVSMPLSDEEVDGNGRIKRMK